MRIERFEITGLYNRFSFSIDLDAKVNIIVGNNGSFKSTLLNILYSILHSSRLQQEYQIHTADVIMKDPESIIGYAALNGKLQDMEKRSHVDKYASELLEQIKNQIPLEQMPDIVVGAEQYRYSIEGKECTRAAMDSHIHADFISTFDEKSSACDEKRSVLDVMLDKLQSEYSFYLADLAKQMTDIIGREGKISKEKLDEINDKKDLMIRFINESFSKTGKTLVPDKGNLTFRFEDGHTISGKALSAGEKQLLIFLLTVLLEKEQPYMVFLDEPEISLHIDWQYKLINMLTALNPKAQFIITTHSPGIFADGWGDKIVYMEDILCIN